MKEISVHELRCNPMDLLAQDWMLVTAGTRERGYNTMTASWGHLGSIWGHGGGLPHPQPEHKRPGPGGPAAFHLHPSFGFWVLFWVLVYRIRRGGVKGAGG